jgi:hypothetical protein
MVLKPVLTDMHRDTKGELCPTAYLTLIFCGANAVIKDLLRYFRVFANSCFILRKVSYSTEPCS